MRRVKNQYVRIVDPYGDTTIFKMARPQAPVMIGQCVLIYWNDITIINAIVKTIETEKEYLEQFK